MKNLSLQSEESLEAADEMKANRFLFKVPAKCNPFTGYGKPMNDTLFVVQSQLIREYAKKGPCIIVGRCADKILEETEAYFSIYICPMEARVKEICGVTRQMKKKLNT